MQENDPHRLDHKPPDKTELMNPGLPTQVVKFSMTKDEKLMPVQDARRSDKEVKSLEMEKQMGPNDPERMPAGTDQGSTNNYSATSKQVPKKTEFDFRDYSNNDNNNDEFIYFDNDDEDDSYNNGYEN